MSLVAYGSSDESDDDDSSVSKTSVNESMQSISLPKKQKETVKITIPSLSEFKDDDSSGSPSKKLKRSTGSGLFSMLPPPKYSASGTSSFTPYVLTKKKETPSTTTTHLKPKIGSAEKPKTAAKFPEASKPSSELESSIEENDDKESVTDFFSLEPAEHSKTEFITNQDTPLQSMDFHTSDVQSAPFPRENPVINKFVTDDLYNIEPKNIPVCDPEESNAYQSCIQDDIEQALLADEGFRKLQGKRNKFEDINIIEVKADDQLTDRNEWLMKSLTEEKIQRPSRKKHDMPTQQQKRKHQITYLAFQAKERELDLKNQWALNSRTKRETQAKYGF